MAELKSEKALDQFLNTRRLREGECEMQHIWQGWAIPGLMEETGMNGSGSKAMSKIHPQITNALHSWAQEMPPSPHSCWMGVGGLGLFRTLSTVCPGSDFIVLIGLKSECPPFACSQIGLTINHLSRNWTFCGFFHYNKCVKTL